MSRERTRPAILTATFTKNINRPGRYGDGRGGYGLSLLVRETANGRLSKTWSQRVRVNGKVTNLGLGNFPLVTLAEARERALENRREIEHGKDPRTPPVPTFEQAARAVWENLAGTWKNPRSHPEWWKTMDQHAFPALGAMRVDKITTADVATCLAPIWADKTPTARKVRQRTGAVMRWAMSMGYRADDPTGPVLDAALPRATAGGQQKACHHSQVPAVLAAVRASDNYWSKKAALELLALTAARSGEVRGMRWEEIDLDARRWTIPASRTKTKKSHTVPLSGRAVEIIEQAASMADTSGLVLPGSNGRELDGSLLSRLLIELDQPTSPHGLRSAFRSWCADTAVDREVAETSLGHVNPNRVEAAYQRSDLFERRAEIMQRWAEHITR